MTVAHVLAIDLGSTGVKTAVVDADGVVRAHAGEVLPLLVGDDGSVEQDPHGWWAALGRCSRRAIAASGLPAHDVRLVAVTSQYTSTVAVDERGMPLANTIMWMDQRGARHHGAVPTDDATRARWVEVHGLMPGGNDDIGQVGIFRDLMPDVYAAAHAFVEPMDHLAARLTGTVTATQNTMFPMLCVDNRVWGATAYSEELLGLSGLDPAKLPPLMPLGAPRGRVTADAAAHLGVAADALVAGATIDSVTTAVGAGAIDADGCAFVVGTTSVMATHLDRKCHDIEHGLTTAPSPLPGSWFLVAENGIGGKALDVFVNQIVYAADGLTGDAPDDAYERVLRLAAEVPAGANGVLFGPWLIGSLAPGFHRRTRAGFVNVQLGTTRGDLARAVLEGVGLNGAWLLPHFAALAERRYDTITMGGGGAASPAWCQIIADCFGAQVRRLGSSRTTNAHGAALLALVETGACSLRDVPDLLDVREVHEPDERHAAVYARLRDALVDFHDRCAPFYDALASTRGATP